MGFLTKIFSKKNENSRVGGMEDYMTLVRVYFQASMAANLGITNLAMLPDLRTFKATLHVPTVNNKLGLGEKAHCRKMMKQLYGTDDIFFKEIDQSLRKNCHKMQDVQTYMIQFQGFTQDLMMLMGNLPQLTPRPPSISRTASSATTETTATELFTNHAYKDVAVMKAVVAIRQYNKRLGFSQQWVTQFVYQVVMLAKKEPKPADDEQKK